MEFDPEAGEPETRSDPPAELVEFCAVVEVDTEVEADVDVDEVAAVVEVTVTVDVLCTVLCETLVLLPVPPVAAPIGDNRTGAPPIEEAALPPKACVATTTEPAPARRTRASTETTDSF